MNLKRVVITGLGTINPLGHTVSEFWDKLEKKALAAPVLLLVLMHLNFARNSHVK